MSKIHWLGTGLSAIPGLKMLIENGHSVIIYNKSGYNVIVFLCIKTYSIG